MITEAELDNILVRQKDLLIQWINKYNDKTTPSSLAELAKIHGALTIISELWKETSYSYKLVELYDRLNKKMDHERVDSVSNQS